MRRIKFIFWNSEQVRIRAGYRITTQLSLKLLLSIGFGYGFLCLIPNIKLDPGIPLWEFSIYGIVIRLLPPLISVWLAGLLTDKRSFAEFGFHFSDKWGRDFLFGLGLGSFLVLPFLVFILIFTCVGIGEEIISRGYLIKNLSEGFNLKRIEPRNAVIAAWILSSVFFGILHIDNPHATLISTTNIIIGGFIFGTGYVITGELAIPIGLHISWNLFQGNIFGFPVSGLTLPADIVTLFQTNQSGPILWTGGAFGPEAGLIGFLAMILGIFITITWLHYTGRRIIIKSSLTVYKNGISIQFDNANLESIV
jgi:uncharacterized protein